MNFEIQGVIVPLVTPFDAQGRVDAAATKRLVDFLIDRGVHGLFPCGTTGEGPLLTTGERQQLAGWVVDAADGRVPVVVHTGAASTAETLALTRHAQATGAQAAALLPPFYYAHSEEALFQHFERVASQVPDLPLFLYNYPAVSNNRLTAELVAALVARCPNIAGLKDSSGGLDLLAACAGLKDGGFVTACGSDNLMLEAFGLGFTACVSGNANVLPELVVALYLAAASGDLERARALQATLSAALELMGSGQNLSLFKGMLARRGVPVGSVRAPLLRAADRQLEACWAGLQALDVPL
jgi:4-hydroxy-tetrahydrodipicolinate synthase